MSLYRSCLEICVGLRLSGSYKVNVRMISDYLRDNLSQDISDFIQRRATNIRVYKLLKISGIISDTYAFSVAYRYECRDLTLDLILKLYADAEIAERECQTLKGLEHVNFPVPHVYISEMNEKLLGAPFIIMEKVEGKTMRDYVKHLSKKETLDIIKCFAETLATLHELKWEEMKLDFLEPLKDEYDYAKKQALWENELPDYVKKQDFDWATNWLEINASKCPCNRYSLLHGDMNPKNFLITKTGRIIVLDWTWPEIGDPLKDVGYAYHNLRHMFGVRNVDKEGAEISAYFLRQYIKSSSRDIDRFAFRFYIFSAGLREAIYLRYLSEKVMNPLSAKKFFGAKSLPLFLFLSKHFRSRYKCLKRFLQMEVMDYEQAMFGTLGGKILSSMEIKDILRFLNAKSSELILDVGTGSGRIAREIVSKMKANVIGIDVGRSTLESAKIRKGNLSGYVMVIADGQYMPFKDASFDAIICIRALKYFPDYTRGISEMVRVLKLGKALILDLSSVLGYEVILRYITHATTARGSHVFNFYKMRNLLRLENLVIVDSIPLQKIPHKMWNLSTNPKILQFLTIGENVLRKITPLILSRSILLKCVKEK